MKTPKLPTIASIAALLRALKTDIGDDYRAYEDCDDSTPSMLVTIGASGASRDDWSYQTGDTSYTGGCYGYTHWGQCALTRRANTTELARNILDQIADSWYSSEAYANS